MTRMQRFLSQATFPAAVYLLPDQTDTPDLAAALRAILAAGTIAAAHALAAEALGESVPGKAKSSTAEQFYTDRIAACEAVKAQCGDNWHLVAGMSGWAAIPARLRSFKTARGTKVAMLPSVRLPAAQFWPHGLPAGVEIERIGPRPAWLTEFLASPPPPL